MEIPNRVTKAWVSELTNDELQQVERQLVEEIRDIEKQVSEYKIYDGYAISFIEPMYSNLSHRANTLRRRYDRICEEFVRRGFRDPSNLLPEGLMMQLPAMPTRYWLMRLSNQELLQLGKKSRNEIQALEQKIARFYRTYPAPPGRDAEVKQVRMELFRQEIFAWFAWAEVMQRDGLIRISGSETPSPIGIGAITTLSDYSAGRAEEMLMDWLERFARNRNQEPLLYDLMSILNEQQRQQSGDEQSGMKSLFRLIAKLIHPDFAVSEEDRILRNEVMSEANKAYEERSETRLREILKSLETH
jgi:hypothetical protein